MRARYRIGPVTVALEAPCLPQDPDNLYFRTFKTTGFEPADLTVRFLPDPPPPREGARALSVLTGHWAVYPAGRRLRLEIRESVRRRTHWIALVSEDWSEIELYRALRARDQRAWSLAGLMEPLVPWWLSAWLGREKRGFAVHAAGISIGGRGGLFSGPSGAGKSTLSGICDQTPGNEVLNDERVIVWLDGGRWRVGGTPWAGNLGRFGSGTAPLERYAFLTQAPDNGWTAWAPSDCLARLLPEVFLPVWHAEWSANVAALALQMLADVPSGELRFRKDPSIRAYLEALMNPAAGARQADSELVWNSKS